MDLSLNTDRPTFESALLTESSGIRAPSIDPADEVSEAESPKPVSRSIERGTRQPWGQHHIIPFGR